MMVKIETMAVVLFSLVFLAVGVWFSSFGDFGMGCLGLVLAWAWAKVNQ